MTTTTTTNMTMTITPSTICTTLSSRAESIRLPARGATRHRNPPSAARSRQRGPKSRSVAPPVDLWGAAPPPATWSTCCARLRSASSCRRRWRLEPGRELPPARIRREHRRGSRWVRRLRWHDGRLPRSGVLRRRAAGRRGRWRRWGWEHHRCARRNARRKQRWWGVGKIYGERAQLEIVTLRTDDWLRRT